MHTTATAITRSRAPRLARAAAIGILSTLALPSGMASHIPGVPQIIELDETHVFFEENATDGDLGIQFFADGDAWDRIMLFTPSWSRLVDIEVKGSTRVIGLTEIFSESAEPSFDDLPRDDFLALFPPGEYKFFGRTVEGDWLFSEVTLTHDFPEPPEIVLPAEEAVVDPAQPLVFQWETVDDPDPPDSVVEAYQVVVEKDEEEERLRVVTADMLPTDTTFTLAPGFLEPGKAYKVELIVIETSGNKVISEVEFETSGGD